MTGFGVSTVLATSSAAGDTDALGVEDFGAGDFDGATAGATGGCGISIISRSARPAGSGSEAVVKAAGISVGGAVNSARPTTRSSCMGCAMFCAAVADGSGSNGRTSTGAVAIWAAGGATGVGSTATTGVGAASATGAGSMLDMGDTAAAGRQRRGHRQRQAPASTTGGAVPSSGIGIAARVPRVISLASVLARSTIGVARRIIGENWACSDVNASVSDCAFRRSGRP